MNALDLKTALGRVQRAETILSRMVNNLASVNVTDASQALTDLREATARIQLFHSVLVGNPQPKRGE